jgi:hypothetical protein
VLPRTSLIPEPVTAVTPPAASEEGPLKRLTPAEALLKRLKPEFNQEYEQLKQEYQQLVSQPANPESQARQEQILSRIDEIATNKEYRKPIFEKKPNDLAIEKEGLALADQLEKLGDTASADGLRTNLENLGGFTQEQKLKYYKDKLLEAQQKAGVAEEMPKEKLGLIESAKTKTKKEKEDTGSAPPTPKGSSRKKVAPKVVEESPVASAKPRTRGIHHFLYKSFHYYYLHFIASSVKKGKRD